MTSKRDLLTALRRAEEDRDTAEQKELQTRRDANKLFEQKALSDAQLAQTRAELRQLSESRSLEIRTEALRQSRSGLGVDLSQAYRMEQYLAKGVTLPTVQINGAAMSNGMKAVARLTEDLDDSYADHLNTILEALQWADRVQRENIELAAENERVRQTAKRTDPLEGFETSDEAKAFNEVYRPTREDGLSIYDTAHTAWMAARDYFDNKPVSDDVEEEDWG